MALVFHNSRRWRQCFREAISDQALVAHIFWVPCRRDRGLALSPAQEGLGMRQKWLAPSRERAV